MNTTRFKAKMLATAIQHTLVIGCLITTTALYSHSALANSSNPSYQIPAGNLAQAINQFAQQSGILLNYDAELVEGKNTTGLKGSYSIEAGFSQLLTPHGLQIQKGNTGYSIVKKATEQKKQETGTNLSHSVTGNDNNNVAHLPVIVVTAETDPSDESKNNYGVSRSSSATKLDLSLKDTPQSITIITQKQIEEQNLQNVNDVLEATPGVTVQNYGVPGAGRASFYSRGYEISNVMVDGAPTLISGSRGMELLAGYDTVIYDRVEITRGSSGLSTGTGDPSASLNFVRKRPSMEAERSAKISYGRWDKKRVELDVSQPFTSDASIRGRFVAAYGQGDSYIDRIKEESKILYGIVEADLGDKTTVALGGTWSDKDVDAASPHMTAGATNSSMSIGVFDGGRNWNAATNWSYAHIRNWNGFFTVSHQFNDQWKLTTNYQYSETTPDRKWGLIGSDWYIPEYNIGSYTVGRENPESKVHNLDISLLGKFDLFGREAQIATGINGYNSKTRSPIYPDVVYNNSTDNICFTEKYRVTRGCVHLNEQVYYSNRAMGYWNNGDAPYPKEGLEARDGFYGQTTEKQYGYFFSTKFEPIQDLKVILGTRYNKYDIDYNHYLNSLSKTFSYEYKPKDKWIPYAGLIYDFNDKVSAYASYTGIYKTQLEKDINDQFLPFIEGNSYELGLKSSLFDDQLNLATAIFRMKEKNYPYVMLEVPINLITGKQYSCTSVTGSICEIKYAADGPTISGFEVTAQGKLTDQWLINAGYTYLHVDQVNGEARSSSYSMNTGDYSYERPKHAINLSTSYQIIEDLTIGSSARWKYKTAQGISNCWMQSNGIESCTSTKERRENLIGNQGSFTIVDLMARYKINDNITTGININNLFDKTYKKNRLSSLYGEPLNVTVSFNFKF